MEKPDTSSLLVASKIWRQPCFGSTPISSTFSQTTGISDGLDIWTFNNGNSPIVHCILLFFEHCVPYHIDRFVKALGLNGELRDEGVSNEFRNR
jgi:hypothetical protein